MRVIFLFYGKHSQLTMGLVESKPNRKTGRAPPQYVPMRNPAGGGGDVSPPVPIQTTMRAADRKAQQMKELRLGEAALAAASDRAYDWLRKDFHGVFPVHNHGERNIISIRGNPYKMPCLKDGCTNQFVIHDTNGHPRLLCLHHLFKELELGGDEGYTMTGFIAYHLVHNLRLVGATEDKISLLLRAFFDWLLRENYAVVVSGWGGDLIRLNKDDHDNMLLCHRAAQMLL